VGDDSHVAFGKKFSGEKCEPECCRDATATSIVIKVQGDIFAYFQAVAIKVTVLCGIDCLACQNLFFENNPLRK
jgi:hypothetical protein